MSADPTAVMDRLNQLAAGAKPAVPSQSSRARGHTFPSDRSRIMGMQVIRLETPDRWHSYVGKPDRMSTINSTEPIGIDADGNAILRCPPDTTTRRLDIDKLRRTAAKGARRRAYRARLAVERDAMLAEALSGSTYVEIAKRWGKSTSAVAEGLRHVSSERMKGC